MGNGYQGEVRKCTHKKTGIVRAVKILSLKNLDEFEHERLQNNIDILKHLNNKYLIKMYEYYEDGHRLYLVTEYCKGGELYDLLMEKK